MKCHDDVKFDENNYSRWNLRCSDFVKSNDNYVKSTLRVSENEMYIFFKEIKSHLIEDRILFCFSYIVGTNEKQRQRTIEFN